MNAFPLSLFLFISIFAYALPTNADTAFKKKIIEDCPAALAQLRSIQEQQERAQLVPYLQRVLLLQTAVRDDLLSLPKMPGQAGAAELNEPFGVDFWRSLQPDREKRARECAAKMLRELAPLSFPSLPDLVSITLEPTATADLRSLAEDTVFTIVIKAAADTNYIPPPEVLTFCLNFYVTRQLFLLRSVFVELGPKAVPFLVDTFKRPGRQMRDLVSALLLEVDSSGEMIGNPLLHLLSSSDDDIRERVIKILSALDGFSPPLLPAIIAHLDDVSVQVQKASFSALEKILASGKSGSLSIDHVATESLLASLKRPGHRERQLAALALKTFLPRDSSAADRLYAAYAAAENDTKALLLPMIEITAPQTDRSFKLIADAAQNSQLPLKLAGIRALSSQTAHSAEMLSLLTTIFKQISRTKPTPDNSRLLLEAANVISAVHPGPAAGHLVPYLVDGLGIHEASTANGEESASVTEETVNSAVTALIAIGAPAIKASLRALRSPDSLVRARAAYVLRRLPPLSRDTLISILALLKDPAANVRAEAKSGLIEHGAPIIPEIKKMANSENADASFAAVEVLLQINPKDTSAIHALLKDTQTQDCSKRVETVSLLAPLNSGDSPVLANTLIQCLADPSIAPAQLTSGLLKLAPLPDAAKEPLLAQLKTVPLSLRLSILEKAQPLALPRQAVTAELVRDLAAGDSPAKLRVIKILTELGSDASAAVAFLQNIAVDEAVEPLLRNAAVTALARISPSAFDIPSFYLREFNSDRAQWARESIRLLPPAQAIPILETALAAIPPDKKAPVIAAAGEFRAKNLIDDLLPLLAESSSELSYLATVSLVKIDPNLPQLTPVLHALFRSDYAPRFLEEEFPPETLPLWDKLSAETASRVEARYLSLLKASAESSAQ